MVNPTFDIDEDSFFSHGIVDINLDVHESTDMIVLHSYELELDVIELHDQNSGDVLTPVDRARNEELEYDLLRFSESLMVDAEYSLHIEFHHNVSTELFGFYRSSYVDQEGDTKWLGVTQFAAGFFFYFYLPGSLF